MFIEYTDADFDRLDEELLSEVIELCVQYSRSRSFAVSIQEARAGQAALDRAYVLCGFMTMPNQFRRYYQMVEQAGECREVLCAENGFTPHNDTNAESMRAKLQAKLPAAIRKARDW